MAVALFPLPMPPIVSDVVFYGSVALVAFSMVRVVFLMKKLRMCVDEMHEIAAKVAELHAEDATGPEREMALRIAEHLRRLGRAVVR